MLTSNNEANTKSSTITIVVGGINTQPRCPFVRPAQLPRAGSSPLCGLEAQNGANVPSAEGDGGRSGEGRAEDSREPPQGQSGSTGVGEREGEERRMYGEIGKLG